MSAIFEPKQPTMDLADAKSFLRQIGRVNPQPGYREKNRAKVIEAFRAFWHSNPTEEEFGEVMKNVTLYAEILFILARVNPDQMEP